MKVLAIGDPHFKISNLPEIDLFISKITEIAKNTKPDMIVVLGDLLHDHEKLNTIPLNKAYLFISKMREISFTVVIVGNHDMASQFEFLSPEHWMNGMKEWKNVEVVDYPIKLGDFTFVPFVQPSRFLEALSYLPDWKSSKAIFCHQEFKGCKMGAIISEIGDEWDLGYPQVISGHIHDSQTPQDNIYYTGSSMQHAFGESYDKTICLITFTDEIDIKKISLNLPKKKIVYLSCDELEKFSESHKDFKDDHIKLVVKGTREQFQTFKKTKKFKDLLSQDFKIAFKPDIRSVDIVEQDEKSKVFKDILYNLIIKEKDTNLYNLYLKIIENKQEEDILLL